MKWRPIVLVFNRCYLPGYRAGGPIKTIENMVERLGDDFDFRIVTLDRDSGCKTAYDGISPNEWYEVGKAKVMYLQPGQSSVRELIGISNAVLPQVVYLNSFFDQIFTQRVLIAKRFNRLRNITIVIAPRGEFSVGALGLKSLKKQLYIKLSSFLGLYRSFVWQASSELEKQDILSVLGQLKGCDVKVANDLAPASQPEIKRSLKVDGEPLRVCFLSRIVPMKNLNFALEVLSEVSVPIHFTIYGPKEIPAYWDECAEIIATLPRTITVDYYGSVHPSSVREMLATHDLFFLPTLGENYGHVIYEALSVGLPVLLSDKTSWSDVSHNHIGWEYPLDSRAAFVEKIEQVYDWSIDEQSRVADRAIQYSEQVSQDDAVIKQNIELFSLAIKR